MTRITKSSTPRRSRPHTKSSRCLLGNEGAYPSQHAAFKPHARSPLRYRRAPDGLASVSRPSNISTRSTRLLSPIREESPIVRRHARRSRSFTNHRDFHFDDTLYDGPGDANTKEEDNDPGECDFEDSFFHWEEESTMLSALLEEDPKVSKDKMEYLANSLQTSFDLEGKEVKKEIAETLVPTVNRVKALYGILDDEVDIAFGKGLLTFNNACKETEAMAIEEQDELKQAYLTSQTKIEKLTVQLEEAYTHRAQLWVDFEKAMNEIVEPTLELLKAMPGNIERTIANLDKHAKALEKDDGAAKKKMKAILNRLS